MSILQAGLGLAGRFHHVGLACRSIADELGEQEILGYRPEGPPGEDPIQRIRYQFLVSADGPRLELIEPTAPDSPVQGILKRGSKFYHLAYETPTFSDTLRDLEDRGFRAISAEAPAVAFGMRRIVFLMSPNLTLIELIESPSSAP